MMKYLRSLTDFVFPRYCEVCGKRLSMSERFLCVNCIRHLPRTNAYGSEENPIERLFWYHLPIEKASSYLFYTEGHVKDLIHLYKYKGYPRLGEYLSRMMALELKEKGFFDDIDAVVPIPIHWKKKMHRGYNQSDYIAHGISSVTNIAVVSDAVKRIKNNKAQVDTSHMERKENVKDIFAVVKPDRIRNRHLLLVDDVITTGSTTMSCGMELAKVPGVKLSILSIAYAGEKFLRT